MISHIVIVSPSREGVQELRWATRNCEAIEVVHGRFEELDRYDCITTAGNSFGLMDAGIDLAVLKFFGAGVQEKIQEMILQDYLGEQPVGTCLLVATGHASCRWVAHSPTMRAPMNIEGTDNVYLAAWATLLAVHRANLVDQARISTLVFPALGTGTGGLSHLEAGTQIRLAVQHYLKPPERITPDLAQDRHERIHYGGRWGFQNPRRIE